MATNKPEVRAWVISADTPYSGFQRHVCMSEDDAQQSRAFLERLKGEVGEELLINISDYQALQAELADMERDYLTIIEAQDAEHRKQVAGLQAECEKLRKDAIWPTPHQKDTNMHQPTDANLSATLHGMTAEVATLHGELYRWMESPDFQPIYQRCDDVGMDHLRAAALRLSVHVAYHLNTLIDWENSEHGVFAYDYCERSLPALLKETLSWVEWRRLAANYTVPADLRPLLREWVAAQPGLVLRSPGRDAAVKKLAEFGLSAEAAAQIHRHGLLNATFYDQ